MNLALYPLPPQAINPVATPDPAKDDAADMASDLQSLETLLTTLQQNPGLATDPIFLSQIAHALTKLDTKFNYIQAVKSIPYADLENMYGEFDTNVMEAQKDPSDPPSANFINSAYSAIDGQSGDLSAFLQALVKPPTAELQLFINETASAQTAFQNYANTH